MTILVGDALDVLRTLPDGGFQCCVTSPPYYGLRDYGMPGQIGLEATPDAYVTRLVDVFREVRRALRDDGVMFLNIGDSYNNFRVGQCGQSVHGHEVHGQPVQKRRGSEGFKEKDLLGIPWMLAFALRADGWFLRQDIIWHKPNPMPESVRDRCTKAHEYVFLLSKSARYFYDADAIREAPTGRTDPTGIINTGADGAREKRHATLHGDVGANARSVWTIATQPYSESHFATMAPALAERCILAGSKPGDAVLDPFGGAGTTGLVADRLQRRATLIELNPAYATMARNRVYDDAPLLGMPA